MIFFIVLLVFLLTVMVFLTSVLVSFFGLQNDIFYIVLISWQLVRLLVI